MALEFDWVWAVAGELKSGQAKLDYSRVFIERHSKKHRGAQIYINMNLMGEPVTESESKWIVLHVEGPQKEIDALSDEFLLDIVRCRYG
jgi:hypothetical protein